MCARERVLDSYASLAVVTCLRDLSSRSAFLMHVMLNKCDFCSGVRCSVSSICAAYLHARSEINIKGVVLSAGNRPKLISKAFHDRSLNLGCEGVCFRTRVTIARSIEEDVILGNSLKGVQK